MNKTTYQREIIQENNQVAVVKLVFWSIPSQKISQVEKLTNQYLDSVTKILENETEDGYDNNFLVMPDEQSKTMIISSSVPDAVLKVNVKEAEALTMVIQDQIQQWK